MYPLLRAAIVIVPMGLLSACGLSDSDRQLLTSADQNAAAAKASADRAAEAAQQAATAAQTNTQLAQSAAQKADMMYQRSLKK